MQSSLAPPAPPYLHMKFATFEDAKEYYQSYAKYHGFVVYTNHRRKLVKTGEYNRAELRCFKSRKNHKKGGMVQSSESGEETSWSKQIALPG